MMRAEITVPSLAMVTLTLVFASSLCDVVRAASSLFINAFDHGGVIRVSHAAVAGHVNRRGRSDRLFFNALAALRAAQRQRSRLFL